MSARVRSKRRRYSREEVRRNPELLLRRALELHERAEEILRRVRRIWKVAGHLLDDEMRQELRIILVQALEKQREARDTFEEVKKLLKLIGR